MMSDPFQEPINVKVIKELLDLNYGARMRTWLGICAHCGLCSKSCFFYLSKGKNPKLTPAYKAKATTAEMYRRRGQVDRKFLDECHDIVWGECTTCGRCSLFCPYGIDISEIVSTARGICNSNGIAPESLVKALECYRNAGNQAGLSTEEFVNICSSVVKKTGSGPNSLQIPIDKAGARIMYTLAGCEPVCYPQNILMAARIFNAAGENWTIPSTGWESTNLAMIAGDKALGGQLVKNMYAKALELGVHAIAIGESGQAYRSARFEGPYMAGCRDGRTPVPVFHSVSLFYEYLKEGRIRIDPDKMIEEPMTYQDPCNVSRNGGLSEEGRAIIKYVAKDFRDMSPGGIYNHCCGGGGGLIQMGREFKKRRLESGRIKAEQIRATAAKIVVTSCLDCCEQVNDLNKEYDLGVKVMTFKEIISNSMIVPDKVRTIRD